ncbi:MAG: hypothetical protein ABI723_25770 [Bacteroidia bacterium]
MKTENGNSNENTNGGNENTPSPSTPPNQPEKNIPVKGDDDNDFTSPKPGVTDPSKVDPTRIEEPYKNDPTRIDNPNPEKK